jgi:hypothetical protein
VPEVLHDFVLLGTLADEQGNTGVTEIVEPKKMPSSVLLIDNARRKTARGEVLNDRHEALPVESLVRQRSTAFAGPYACGGRVVARGEMCREFFAQLPRQVHPAARRSSCRH